MCEVDLSPEERDELVVAVTTYLRLCEARDLGAAREYLAPDAVLIFPAGVQYTRLEDMVADADSRYRWVRKSLNHSDAFGDSEGRPVVVSRGKLVGESLSGRQFSDVRYQDRFVFREGKIVDQQVWNDLAACGLLDR